MPYIKYRLTLESELKDEHKVLHKHPPIEVSTVFIKDIHTDNYKYRRLLREDMYRKIENMCASLEEGEVVVDEESPTEEQIACATCFARRMCVELPKEYTKEAYSAFIDEWEPLVIQEEMARIESKEWKSVDIPSEWKWQY